MGGVFISYRRDDSQGSAGRLYDDLKDRFGKRLVFRDIDAIEAGVDYAAEIVKTIEECDALVAVIGRGWVEARDKAGNRRLDSPKDLVRLEIAAALEGGKVVIPVLLEDAVMPTETELPEPLLLLSSRNALPTSDLRWDYDVGRLASRLERVIQPPATPVIAAEPAALQPPSAGRPTSARSGVRLVVGGLIAGMVLLLLVQKLILGNGGGETRTTGNSAITTAPMSSDATSSEASSHSSVPAPNLKTWNESEAIVTSRDGATTVVQAATLEAGGAGPHVILASGQRVPFEKMRTLEIPTTLPDLGSKAFRVQGVITLLSGETITQVIEGFTTLYASNNLGKFSLDGEEVMRVDFKR